MGGVRQARAYFRRDWTVERRAVAPVLPPTRLQVSTRLQLGGYALMHGNFLSRVCLSIALAALSSMACACSSTSSCSRAEEDVTVEFSPSMLTILLVMVGRASITP